MVEVPVFDPWRNPLNEEDSCVAEDEEIIVLVADSWEDAALRLIIMVGVGALPPIAWLADAKYCASWAGFDLREAIRGSRYIYGLTQLHLVSLSFTKGRSLCFVCSVWVEWIFSLFPKSYLTQSFIQSFALSDTGIERDTYTISRSHSAQMFCPVGRPPVLALFTGALTGALTWWVAVGPKDTFEFAWYCCCGLGLNERGSSTYTD